MAFRYQGQPFSGVVAFSEVAAVLRRRGDRRAASAARLRSIFETSRGSASSQDCNAGFVQLHSSLFWSVVELCAEQHGRELDCALARAHVTH